MAAPWPKLVVFDLDYTLWPFWIDTHAAPPPYAARDGGAHAVDRHGFVLRLFDEVPAVLAALHARGVAVGVASRTDEPEWARALMGLLSVSVPGRGGGGGGGARTTTLADAVHHAQIFPGDKQAHFHHLARASGVAFGDMLFFDDEHRNIASVSRLGVTAVLVDDAVGVSLAVLREGVRRWRADRGLAGAVDGDDSDDEGCGTGGVESGAGARGAGTSGSTAGRRR
jgi:magnesium-dependent phosphatase 1